MEHDRIYRRVYDFECRFRHAVDSAGESGIDKIYTLNRMLTHGGSVTDAGACRVAGVLELFGWRGLVLAYAARLQPAR